MKAFTLHFALETKSAFRKKQLLFLTYFFPLGFYLMMGAVMPQLNPFFLDSMIPAMMIFAVMTSSFMGIPEQLVTARSSGVFRGYRINGVPASSLLIIPVLTTLLHLTIVSLLILISAPLIFDAPAPVNYYSLFPILFLAVFSCSGLSLFIGTIASNSRTSIILSQIIFIPSMLIGGLMIPFNILPENIQKIALLLPSTHLMNLFRALSYGKTTDISPAFSIAVTAGIGAAAIILSRIMFRWDDKRK